MTTVDRQVPAKRPAVIDITSPRAWRILMSPVRTEIAETLRASGAMSIAELAAAVGRPADTLYRHVEQLKAAGFVVTVGVRKSGRHLEQIIDVAADDFRLELADARGEQENQAVVDTVRAFGRAAERAARDAAAARELRFDGPSRNIAINYELGWLTPERFQEVRALVRRLKTIMDDAKAAREGRLYMTLVIACPVARARPKRTRAAGRTGAAPRSRPTRSTRSPGTQR
jgi:predicted transcriptional regulator